MHRRATAIRDFYRQHYTEVPDTEHELWHPNKLRAVKTTLDRLQAQPAHSKVTT